LETDRVVLKGKAQLIKVFFDEIPAVLDEFIVEPIWTRGFVIGEIFHHCFNFCSSEGFL
jgi:hypothetical protein